jgi:hypothetical protein
MDRQADDKKLDRHSAPPRYSFSLDSAGDVQARRSTPISQFPSASARSRLSLTPPAPRAPAERSSRSSAALKPPQTVEDQLAAIMAVSRAVSEGEALETTMARIARTAASLAGAAAAAIILRRDESAVGLSVVGYYGLSNQYTGFSVT